MLGHGHAQTQATLGDLTALLSEKGDHAAALALHDYCKRVNKCWVLSIRIGSRRSALWRSVCGTWVTSFQQSHFTGGGSASLFVLTWLEWKWKHPCSQELDTRAAVHGALERFEPIDLAFRLTAAPRLRDGVLHGLDVARQRCCELLH
jgi:hypothetical protein